MSQSGRLFTSESVTEGHPDKICDAISDSVLDALLAQDPHSRVAVETLVTTGQVHVAGEVTTSANVDIPTIVRDRILEIGYDSSAKGFDGNSCGVNIAIGKQSPDIAQGVDTAHETRVEGTGDPLDKQGAGDQGLMFGYAINDTPELMPLPIALAHRLSRRLTEVRKGGVLPYLRPDGKTQVTIEYDGTTPVRLDTVVISTQHAADIDLDNLLAPDIREKVLNTVLDDLAHETLDTSSVRLLVNPTGKFVLGGPMGDAGLDRPQDHRRHLRRLGPPRRRRVLRQGSVQGGPFRGVRDALGGKERRRRGPGRPGRGAGRLRDRQGRPGRACSSRRSAPRPSTRPGSRRRSLEVFDLRPGAIIRDLDLLRPIYAQTAAYGHFGRTDIDLPWEQLNKVDDLKAVL